MNSQTQTAEPTTPWQEVAAIANQHMPTDYHAELIFDPETGDGPRTGELAVIWHPAPLAADKGPIVGKVKIQLNTENPEPQEAAETILNIIAGIAKRGRDFHQNWQKKHEAATNAMRAARQWEMGIRFNAHRAAKLIAKHLPDHLTAEITVPEHSTEIITPTQYGVKAHLTVTDNNGAVTFNHQMNLYSDENNSHERIANYFTNHTHLQKTIQQAPQPPSAQQDSLLGLFPAEGEMK